MKCEICRQNRKEFICINCVERDLLKLDNEIKKIIDFEKQNYLTTLVNKIRNNYKLKVEYDYSNHFCGGDLDFMGVCKECKEDSQSHGNKNKGGEK